jgi:hypothetical protein
MPSPWRYLPPLLLCTLLLASVGSTACSTFSPSEPPLPDTTMTKVLVELHLANARSNHVGTIPPGLKDSVFARYGIERSEFESTLRHYSRHPDAFDALYNTVIDTLNAIESDLRRPQYSRPQTRPGSPSRRPE